MSFGRLFFAWFIICLEIFRRGWSVSGYILAAPGIGRRKDVVASGLVFLTCDFGGLTPPTRFASLILSSFGRLLLARPLD